MAMVGAGTLSGCGGDVESEAEKPSIAHVVPPPCVAAVRDPEVLSVGSRPGTGLVAGFDGVFFVNYEANVVFVDRSATAATTILTNVIDAAGPIALTMDRVLYASLGGGVGWVRPAGGKGTYLSPLDEPLALRMTPRGVAASYADGFTLPELGETFPTDIAHAFEVTGSQVFYSNDALVEHRITDVDGVPTVGPPNVFGPKGAWALVADDSHLFVGGDGVWRAPRNDLTRTEGLFSQPATGLAVSGPCLYVSGSSGVWRLPKEGGPPVLLVTGGVDAFVTDGSYLYWTRSNTLRRRALP